MKTILFFLLTFCLAFGLQTAHCQRGTVQGDTMTNATTQTLTTDLTLNNLVGVQATVIKVSGTVAGTAILQGTIDGVGWQPIDTLTLANVATNTQVFSITPATHSYRQYRVVFTTSGTQVSVPRIAWLRRQ
jgi:hypothetical protein